MVDKNSFAEKGIISVVGDCVTHNKRTIFV